MITIETISTAKNIATLFKSQQHQFQYILKYYVAGVRRAQAADNSFACVADGCSGGDWRRSGGMMLMVVVIAVVMIIIIIIIHDNDYDDDDAGDNEFAYD